MAGLRYNITSYNNFACPYCTKRWKTFNGFIEKHIQEKHLEEAYKAQHKIDQQEIFDLRESKRIIPKPVVKPEKRHELQLYCSHCKTAFRGSVPTGISLDNIVHSKCGNLTLNVITNRIIGL